MDFLRSPLFNNQEGKPSNCPMERLGGIANGQFARMSSKRTSIAKEGVLGALIRW